jgi:hypothetical protein
MDCYSIYIPRMMTSWTEKGVIDVMERFSIGLVNRVDFTPVNAGPGFRESADDTVMSAFVHFDFPYIMEDKRYQLYGMDNCNNMFWKTIEEDNAYRLQISRREYWICLKNRDPVPRTRMNIHQIVENCRFLENIVATQNAKIYRLEQLLVTQDRALRSALAMMTKWTPEQSETLAPPHIDINDEDDDASSVEDEQLCKRKQERNVAI